MTLNKVFLIGRLGKDPEIKTTPQGHEIALFSLATTDNWRDKSTGEKKKKTEWHKVIIFNVNLIYLVKNFIKKGTQIYLEGRLQTRKWSDKKTNEEKFITEIILNDFSAAIQILDNKITEPAQHYSERKEPEDNFSEDLDDDIPF